MAKMMTTTMPPPPPRPMIRWLVMVGRSGG
jgi:hypothetical protein